MTIVISGGVYNAADATCGPPGCINCCGYSGFANTPGDGFVCTVGENMPFTTTATDCSGNHVGMGGSWSSDNTSYATMNASTMTGQSPGAVTIGDYLGNVVVYSGQFCAGYDCPTSAPQITSGGNVVPIISGPVTVWRFNGSNNPNPSAFPVSITLSAPGASSWAVTSGSSKINLSPNGSQATITPSNTADSCNLRDVCVTASGNGQTSSPYCITVDSPWKLVARAPATSPDTDHGYTTFLDYDVHDTFDQEMTGDIGWFETLGPQNSTNGSNWASCCGLITATGASITTPLEDGLEAPSKNNQPAPSPTPTWTTASGTNFTSYREIGQSIFVGASSGTSGWFVQSDTLTYYLDHGGHVNPTSPQKPVCQ